jgi:hypothetical protein
MLRKWFIITISVLIANFMNYQILSFILWNWDFETWHWFARLILGLMLIGSFNYVVKELKNENTKNNN